MGVYTKEEELELIYQNLYYLENIDNQYEDVCLEIVKQSDYALAYVKEQTEKICLEAVRKNGFALQYVKEQTENICLEAVKQVGESLKFVEEQTKEICLEAVKEDGYAIQFVKEQTEDICLEAVKTDGYAIQFVKEQTENVCLEAVKENGEVLEYVKEQTLAINLQSVKNYGESIKIIKKRSPEICFYALLNDYNLSSFKYIKIGIDKFIKRKAIIKGNIFCIKEYKVPRNRIQDRRYKNYVNGNKDISFFDINSLIYLKDYLIKENSTNTFILKDTSDINVLKEIAVSNNELVIVDTGNIKDVHRILANRIIKEEDLEKELF